MHIYTLQNHNEFITVTMHVTNVDDPLPHGCMPIRDETSFVVSAVRDNFNLIFINRNLLVYTAKLLTSFNTSK